MLHNNHKNQSRLAGLGDEGFKGGSLATIRLENLSISSEHAGVLLEHGVFYIEGQSQQDGNRVALGCHQIGYLEEDLAANRAFEKTLLVMPIMKEMMVEGVNGEAGLQPAGLAKFKVLNGPSHGW